MLEQECVGLIFEWFFNQTAGVILGTIGGAIAGAMIPAIRRDIHRRQLASKISKAYYHFQHVCEPKVLDPERPGNPDYMKARARDAANLLTGRLERAGFVPPPRCTTEDNSLQEWYRFLEHARMVIE